MNQSADPSRRLLEKYRYHCINLVVLYTNSIYREEKWLEIKRKMQRCTEMRWPEWRRRASITASSPLGCNIVLRTTQIFAETWRLESGVVSLVCQFVGDSK